jgi:hypothetical protein
MTMVIGLVLHASHRALFEDAARILTGVTLEWVGYEHEHEIREEVRTPGRATCCPPTCRWR